DLALERAAMLLSRQRWAEAASIARELQAVSGQEAAGTAESKRILCVGLIGAGERSPARPLCESCLADQEAAGDPVHRRAARFSTAEARIESGDATGATHLLKAWQSSLENLPDSNWKALALLARADRTRAADYSSQAQHVLEDMTRQWGEGTIRT